MFAKCDSSSTEADLNKYFENVITEESNEIIFFFLCRKETKFLFLKLACQINPR